MMSGDIASGQQGVCQGAARKFSILAEKLKKSLLFCEGKKTELFRSAKLFLSISYESGEGRKCRM